MSANSSGVWLGEFVARHWFWVICGWLVLLGVTHTFAPRWDDVTYDGDLAYMPAEMSSVRAERLMEQAFPERRSRSDMVVVASRERGPLTAEDRRAIDRVAARFYNLLALARLSDGEPFSAETVDPADPRLVAALESLDQALELDPECALAWNNRSVIGRRMGDTEAADRDRQLAADYGPGLEKPGERLLPSGGLPLPLVDVWSRHTDVVGSKLLSRDRHAELLVVRLTQEFMATDNIRVLQRLEAELADVRRQAAFPAGLQLGITGSAAVGGDMLRSSAESIRNTEFSTVLLVVLILALVYRAPLLVAVPMITIGVSVGVSTGLVAALTQLHHVDGFAWWNFRIFTTTKIFVFVILFGAGTDFCLFLIARYKEELEHGISSVQAVARALHGVSDALVASALTTIVGLGMMFFADFGKFRNSGPAIGLCLLVTLAACLTLAPALLSACREGIFWPFPLERNRQRPESRMTRLWERLAHRIVAHPGRVLILCLGIMTPWALLGASVDVTYDFLSELSADCPSRVATDRLHRHFSVGETSPVVVLAKVPRRSLDTPEGKAAIEVLTRELYVDGVTAVRSLSQPKGDRPVGYSLKKAALQAHALTRSLYLGRCADGSGDVTRLEVLLAHEPFSSDALHCLEAIGERLDRVRGQRDGYWQDAEFLFAGTTAGIRDLREVTRGDNLRIQVLVVLAVLAVLLLILRRPTVCIYLILSVLFSYYVTMGITETFFQWTYGETFHGLDWKVPLFLFVILVAVGQDYNIYLATRVFEEQRTHGLFGGLRRAIVHTGGIITSCGVIMAGTFVSMMSGSLRGMVELGFALSLGVLLDTLVVRPVLVPAFLALLFRGFAAAPVLRVAMRAGQTGSLVQRKTS